MSPALDRTRAAASPHLRLLLADGCNLRCSYCHFHASHEAALAEAAGRGEAAVRRVLPPADAVQALREVAQVLRERGEDHLDLSLYGGEPLVNPKALEAVLDEVQVQRAAGLSVAVIVNTNATLVDEAVAARWAAVGVRAHVSLDGADAARNARRRLHGGAASLEPALRGLARLQRAGVAVQLNVVLDPEHPQALAGLLPLARQAGADQVFVALPDDAQGAGVGDPSRWLPVLRSAWWQARRLNLKLVGPWGVGLRDPETGRSLPFNLAVRPDGRAYLPHRPDAPDVSAAALLAAPRWAALEADWQALRAGCAACPIDARCRGYQKFMTRYHAGIGADAGPQCTLAQEFARMFDEAAHRPWRTAPWLTVSATPDEDAWLLHHPALALPLEVSAGVVDLLDHFLPASTEAEANEAFESEDLADSLRSLREAGLLQPDDDTEVERRWMRLAGPDAAVTGLPGLVIAAADAATRDRVDWLHPHLLAAQQRLPPAWRPIVDRLPVLVVADRAAFADATRWPPDHPALDWMAATVAQGLLVVQVNACEAVRRHGGRARLAAFQQQLAHELAHLVLARRGLRLPVWLEEGLCEHLSGAPWDDGRLGDALPQADEFAGFVRAVLGLPSRDGSPPRSGDWSPATTLLSFSDAPVDVHPGYALAHGFVRSLVDAHGLDALLDEWAAQGLRARLGPRLPGDPSDGAPAREALARRLETWLAAETRRLHLASPFSKPMRVVPLGTQALVYHRIVGGHAWVERAAADELAALAERNLALDEVESLLDGHPQRAELLGRWRAGQLARQRGFHLRLTVEGGCNMRCTYCYEGEKRRQAMDVATADRAIAAWRDLLEPADLPGSTVRLFGGEPFMNWPLMQHVFRTATVGLPAGSVSWFVNTNGTLVRDEHVAWLAERPDPLLVHLSLDGVGAVNDRDRIFLNGRGTFEHVDRAARRMLGGGLDLNLSMVLTPASARGLPSLLDYVARLRDDHPGASLSLSIKPVIGPGLPADDARLMQEALRRGLARGAALGLDIGGEPQRAANLLFQDATPTGHFCGIGGRELYVAPDGRLLACHAMPGTEYAHVDDVAREGRIPVPAEIRGRHAGAVDGCSGCEVEGLCGGGCMAHSRLAHGSVARKPPDDFCRMMKGVFRDAVHERLQARADAAARRMSEAPAGLDAAVG
jgi:uncharacterized protein